jgi:ribosomal protein L6P/L9E
MLKRHDNIFFLVPPEFLFYFDFFNFFFIGLNGWLLKCINKHFIFLFKSSINGFRFFFSSSALFHNLVFGLIKYYFKFLQLRGRSYRFLFLGFHLIVRFGYSHKLYYSPFHNVCLCLINKQVLKIYGRSLGNINSVFFDIHSMRKFDKYKGKGLLFYKDNLILKVSSKKNKV